MKAAFIINARNKGKHVVKSVLGALTQTYPCHIFISDIGSTDGSFELMEKTIAEFKMPLRIENGKEVPFHKVELVHCPFEGQNNMSSHNKHVAWIISQLPEAEWIFQSASDDYSLPGRVAACMKAVEKNPCSIVATNMYFIAPGEEPGRMMSGVPEGYIPAGPGLQRLVYGSTIHGFHRDFLNKVLPIPASCTMDVYLGYLAALDNGYYVVGEPLHVHLNAADVNNMGFMGKMRGAEKDGNKEEIMRLNELNRLQLFELYFHCKLGQQKFYPLSHAEDQNACLQMMTDQSVGWYYERMKLNEARIAPGFL